MIHPQAVKATNELNIELNSFHNIPQSFLLDRNKHQKLDSTLIEAFYKVNADYDQITKFYKSELADHGWKYDNEKSIMFSGKDFGIKELSFSKDKYSLDIFYPRRTTWGKIYLCYRIIMGTQITLSNSKPS